MAAGGGGTVPVLMRLHQPFVRLPLQVDADRLADEVGEIDEDAWRDHPEGAPGNTALPLVAAGGDPADDTTRGAMAPTPHLALLPYTRQVLAALSATIGRTRFMRIAQETELHSHVDSNYYWWHHLRVHVPVRTTPDVRFEVGDAAVHMAPGEVWTFDTWRPHRVDNPASSHRVHLVVDTVGSAALWDLIEHPDGEPKPIAYDEHVTPLLPIETSNWPVVMSPDEVDATVAALLSDAAGRDPDAVGRIARCLERFRRDWRDAHARFGTAPQGAERYRELVVAADDAIRQMDVD